MNLGSVLFFAYVGVEAALVVLLTHKRVWRTLPYFCAYCTWDLINNVALYAGTKLFNQSVVLYDAKYLQIYTIETIIDSALLFCVLVELAWSVLRPIRASLPRYVLVVITIVLLLIAAVIWPFAGFSGLAHSASNQWLMHQWLMLTQLQHTVSILRILFFFLLAGGSQILSIGWRDRELQIATGLGLYSLVSVAVSILQGHLNSGSEYVRLYNLDVLCFLCSLLYWTYCFAQKEAERRPFTPEMQRVLLAVAGAAHANRIALTESRPGKPHRHD